MLAYLAEVLVVLLAGTAMAVSLANTPPPPCNLRCEYLHNPLAVESAHPLLSWELQDTRRGASQQAFELLVASTEALAAAYKGDLWSSGEIETPECHTLYQGQKLKPGQLCYWRVRYRDESGEVSPWSEIACWGAGLASEDWQADWITDAPAHDTFKPANNGFHSAFSPIAESKKHVTLDLGASRLIDAVKLYPARPFDWIDTPGFLFPEAFRIETAEDPSFAQAQVVVDESKGFPNPGDVPVTFTFEPHKARFVRLVVNRCARRDANSGYAFALAEFEVLSKGKNIALRAQVEATDSITTPAWAPEKLVDGECHSHGPKGLEPLPAPRLRKAFNLAAKPRRATLYLTALGFYRAFLNGQRVGEGVLVPGWSDYRQLVYYQAYDVTDLLQKGPNAIAALIGDGWYAGRLGMSQTFTRDHRERALYGRKPWLKCRLVVELPEGKCKVLTSDTSWQASSAGPVRASDLLDGELYDARRVEPGWTRADFNASGWHPAVAKEFPEIKLEAQRAQPICKVAEIEPVALKEPLPGVWVFHLPQNLAGWARLKLQAPRGTKVTLQYGERLKEDGSVYTANLRTAKQCDTYIASGEGAEVFEPHFTYHGFQYVEVRGLVTTPKLSDLTAIALSTAAPQAGTFECSNELLNKLWQATSWTQRANLMSVPTDCPQRDERLGWMGDIQVFCQTAIYNADLVAFFRKWLEDVRQAQAKDGRFPDLAPNPYDSNVYFSGAPAWADAGVIVPWKAYVNYGDKRFLADQYEAAKRWVEYVHAHNPDLLWRHKRGNDYGDWLNADRVVLPDWPVQGGEVPKEVFASAFFAHSLDLVGRYAKVLGKTDEAEHYKQLFEQARAAFCRAYLQADGKIEGDTQAGYVLALSFDLLPLEARPKALEHLLAAEAPYHGHLSCGIQTASRAMACLAEAGLADEFYRLLLLKTCPSWGYMLEQGATTIWERWDGYVAGRGLQDEGMNSFNHWAFGAVSETLYSAVLGLRPDETAPGWRHFYVKPLPGGGLEWAKGTYHSPYGVIEVEGHQHEGLFELSLTVPPSSSADLYLPAKRGGRVTEGARPLEQVEGCVSLGWSEGYLHLRLASGKYHFQAEYAE